MHTLKRDEYLTLTITSNVDLDEQDVEVAVTLNAAAPTEADWRMAEWIGDADKERRARLVPGWDEGLVAGVYGVWARVHDAPETPVIYAGFGELR